MDLLLFAFYNILCNVNSNHVASAFGVEPVSFGAGIVEVEPALFAAVEVEPALLAAAAAAVDQ